MIPLIWPQFWPLIPKRQQGLTLDTNYSLLILIPWLAITDPEAVIPDTRVVIPDLLYLRNINKHDSMQCLNPECFSPLKKWEHKINTPIYFEGTTTCCDH